MGDHYAESAAVFADSARAAVAFLRAIRDGRHDDLKIITEGINPFHLALQIGNVALNQDITDEFLDLQLEFINRADADGSFEEAARKNDLLGSSATKEENSSSFHSEIIGETPGGLAIGTIAECGICKTEGVCCGGGGNCIVITHPVQGVVQHVTVIEVWALTTLLMMAVRKARV